MPWFADQSRYISGYECPWRRLIRYHMMGTGLAFEFIPEEIQIGGTVHSKIENIYLDVKSTGILPTKETTPDSMEGIVKGLVHAYARVVIPWVAENYEISESRRSTAWTSETTSPGCAGPI